MEYAQSYSNAKAYVTLCASMLAQLASNPGLDISEKWERQLIEQKIKAPFYLENLLMLIRKPHSSFTEEWLKIENKSEEVIKLFQTMFSPPEVQLSVEDEFSSFGVIGSNDVLRLKVFYPVLSSLLKWEEVWKSSNEHRLPMSMVEMLELGLDSSGSTRGGENLGKNAHRWLTAVLHASNEYPSIVNEERMSKVMEKIISNLDVRHKLSLTVLDNLAIIMETVLKINDQSTTLQLNQLSHPGLWLDNVLTKVTPSSKKIRDWNRSLPTHFWEELLDREELKSSRNEQWLFILLQWFSIEKIPLLKTRIEDHVRPIRWGEVLELHTSSQGYMTRYTQVKEMESIKELKSSWGLKIKNLDQNLRKIGGIKNEDLENVDWDQLLNSVAIGENYQAYAFLKVLLNNLTETLTSENAKELMRVLLRESESDLFWCEKEEQKKLGVSPTVTIFWETMAVFIENSEGIFSNEKTDLIWNLKETYTEILVPEIVIRALSGHAEIIKSGFIEEVAQQDVRFQPLLEAILSKTLNCSSAAVPKMSVERF